MPYYDTIAQEHKCQINEITDIECSSDAERSIIIPPPDYIELHVCAEHYEIAREYVEKL